MEEATTLNRGVWPLFHSQQASVEVQPHDLNSDLLEKGNVGMFLLFILKGRIEILNILNAKISFIFNRIVA